MRGQCASSWAHVNDTYFKSYAEGKPQRIICWIWCGIFPPYDILTCWSKLSWTWADDLNTNQSHKCDAGITSQSHMQGCAVSEDDLEWTALPAQVLVQQQMLETQAWDARFPVHPLLSKGRVAGDGGCLLTACSEVWKGLSLVPACSMLLTSCFTPNKSLVKDDNIPRMALQNIYGNEQISFFKIHQTFLYILVFAS